MSLQSVTLEVTKLFWCPLTSIVWTGEKKTFIKNVILCSSKESKSYRFGGVSK